MTEAHIARKIASWQLQLKLKMRMINCKLYSNFCTKEISKKNFIGEHLNLRYLTSKWKVLQSNKQMQSDLSR